MQIDISSMLYICMDQYTVSSLINWIAHAHIYLLDVVDRSLVCNLVPMRIFHVKNCNIIQKLKRETPEG